MRFEKLYLFDPRSGPCGPELPKLVFGNQLMEPADDRSRIFRQKLRQPAYLTEVHL
jgi:hypothetical protein